MKYSLEQLQQRYVEYTASIKCECEFATELVGGQPGDEAGIAAFVRHHLEITDPKEASAAVRRIMNEEIGEHGVALPTDELAEKESYGVCMLRRSEHGPWLGDWQIKACIKQAASRLNLFSGTYVGAKGDLAEAGQVVAVGKSLQQSEHPERIHLVNPNGEKVETYYTKFMGRVSTPNGKSSIVHDSECAAPGTRFAFEYRFLNSKLKEDDVLDLLSLAMVVGLGSARSLERGHFKILSADLSMPARPGRRIKDKKEPTKQQAIA